MRLEEGVREGRLVKESTPPKSLTKKEQEVSMVKGRLQRWYPAYQHVAVVIPVTNVVQNLGYQPQFQQY